MDALLFGESQSRVIITTAGSRADEALARCQKLGIPAVRLGEIGGDQLVIRTPVGEWQWPVAALHDRWWNAVDRAMR